jgi:hypothetical protein
VLDSRALGKVKINSFYLVETVSAGGPDLFYVNKDYTNYPSIKKV